jgi:hypothetical protein
VVLEQCLVDGLAAFAGEHQFDQLGRPGQAARMRGQDAPLLDAHQERGRKAGNLHPNRLPRS